MKTSINTVAIVAGLMSGISTMASAQQLNIADNDSVYVDAKSFQMTAGKAKGDIATQIKALGARSLSSDAIIFRSGDKIYITDGAPAETVAMTSYTNGAVDPNPADRFAVYAVDPNNPTITSQNSTASPNPADRFAVYAVDPTSPYTRSSNGTASPIRPIGPLSTRSIRPQRTAAPLMVRRRRIRPIASRSTRSIRTAAASPIRTEP